MQAPTRPNRLRRGTLVAVALCLAMASVALAAHVEPEFIEGPDNHACSEFAPEGATWMELKVDPPEDGNYTSGNLTVAVDIDAAGKVFDWTAEGGLVMAVFVKAGRAGHHLYTYEGGATADTGLTSPGEGERNQISHISFCFVPEEDEPTCEDTPDLPECQPTCEDTPDLPECQPTCEDTPDLPECQQTCEDTPDLPECQQTCEDTPDLPECQETVCPITVAAVANAGETVTVTVDATGEFDLYRSENGGEPVLLGHFSGDTEYEDTETRASSAYTYTVMVGDEVCDEVTVTAIPVFPSAIAALAAAALAVLGYVAVARRR